MIIYHYYRGQIYAGWYKGLKERKFLNANYSIASRKYILRANKKQQ